MKAKYLLNKKEVIFLLLYFKEHKFCLYSLDPPTLPSFTVKPVNQTAQEGQRVTFYCTALGNPSPTITWSKLAGSIPADRRQEPSPGSLRIINLQADDDGIYICTAQNFMGNVTAQVFLRIQGEFAHNKLIKQSYALAAPGCNLL